MKVHMLKLTIMYLLISGLVLIMISKKAMVNPSLMFQPYFYHYNETCCMRLNTVDVAPGIHRPTLQPIPS